jgi:hypothetical protein
MAEVNAIKIADGQCATGEPGGMRGAEKYLHRMV